VVALLVLAAALFSFLNSAARVTVDLGFTVFYRISLVGLVFGAFLFGMIAMFLFSLRYDRSVRNLLREYARRGVVEMVPLTAGGVAQGMARSGSEPLKRSMDDETISSVAVSSGDISPDRTAEETSGMESEERGNFHEDEEDEPILSNANAEDPPP
jgi:hypothetical protein